MKYCLFLAFLFYTSLEIVLASPLESEQVTKGLVQSVKKGNVDELALFFNESVEINLIGKENIYSIPQAKQVLKDFFVKYRPVDFSVIHEGGKQESMYVIGILETTKDKLRITFLMKKQGDKQVIYQMHIDREDDR